MEREQIAQNEESDDENDDEDENRPGCLPKEDATVCKKEPHEEEGEEEA